MSLVRLIYFSENRFSLVRKQAAILELEKLAVERNRTNNISGALVHDDLWFIQALEGDEQAVRATFSRIGRDPRHGNLKIVRLAPITKRMFGDWAMGFAARTAETDQLFGTHWYNKGMNPAGMSEKDILNLMTALGRQGLMRSGAARKANAMTSG